MRWSVLQGNSTRQLLAALQVCPEADDEELKTLIRPFWVKISLV